MRLSSDVRETGSDQRGEGYDGTDSEHDSGTGREYEIKKAKGGEEREGQAELKVKMNGALYARDLSLIKVHVRTIRSLCYPLIRVRSRTSCRDTPSASKRTHSHHDSERG